MSEEAQYPHVAYEETEDGKVVFQFEGLHGDVLTVIEDRVKRTIALDYPETMTWSDVARDLSGQVMVLVRAFKVVLEEQGIVGEVN